MAAAPVQEVAPPKLAPWAKKARERGVPAAHGPTLQEIQVNRSSLFNSAVEIHTLSFPFTFILSLLQPFFFYLLFSLIPLYIFCVLLYSTYHCGFLATILYFREYLAHGG